MKQKAGGYRWFVVAVFFFFMLLHQTDKLLIGPLKGQISDDFKITNTQFGAVITGALIVGTILYPIWGYLYDRFARAKLLSLASFIWGSTTWLSAIVRTYPAFVATRASTGIDDSSYPGLYTLIADYFGPQMRSKVYGLLQLSQPIGYLIGMVLALMVAPGLGWRNIFYFTGGIGILLAVLIFFGVKEMPRGKAEPEFEGMAEMTQFRFSWEQAKQVLQKRTMWFVFLQGFAGVFPWNVITYFFCNYLPTTKRRKKPTAVCLCEGAARSNLQHLRGDCHARCARSQRQVGSYFLFRLPGKRARLRRRRDLVHDGAGCAYPGLWLFCGRGIGRSHVQTHAQGPYSCLQRGRIAWRHFPLFGPADAC